MCPEFGGVGVLEFRRVRDPLRSGRVLSTKARGIQIEVQFANWLKSKRQKRGGACGALDTAYSSGT